MNLEISIKHIITNQRRAGGGFLRPSGCLAVSAALSDLGPGRRPPGQLGLRSGPGTPPLLGKVKSDPCGGSRGVVTALGVMFSGPSYGAGSCISPRPRAGLRGGGESG